MMLLAPDHRFDAGSAGSSRWIRLTWLVLLCSMPTLLQGNRARSEVLALEGDAAARMVASASSLPIGFVENHGQAHPSLRFLWSRGRTVHTFGPEGVAVRTVLADAHQDPPGRLSASVDAPASGAAPGSAGPLDPPATQLLRQRFVGADPGVRIEAGDALPGKINLLLGQDSQRWQIGLPHYESIRYRELYPGIDWVLRIEDGQPQGHFVVAPGADVSRLRWRYEGWQGASLEFRARAWSLNGSGIRPLPAAIQQAPDGSFGLETGPVDGSASILVAPNIGFQTYLGGSLDDQVQAVAVDSADRAVILGDTWSTNFPTVDPFQDNKIGSGSFPDLFLAKLSPNGDQLVFATYLGGAQFETGLGLALAAGDEIVLTGYTRSQDFPMEAALQDRHASPNKADAFVTRMNADASGLIFSTYFGGRDVDIFRSLALDPSGAIHLAGDSYSADLPVTNPLQRSRRGPRDAVIAKLSGDGQQWIYATYFGGTDAEVATGIAADAGGRAHVMGSTGSRNLPIERAHQSGSRGGSEAFVAKLEADGSALLYSTYLGGRDADNGGTIAVDSAGHFHALGYSQSIDFPRLNPYQAVHGGGVDAFLSSFDETGQLLQSGLFGGSRDDFGVGIDVDRAGRLLLVGQTDSPDFPVIDAVQNAPGGLGDAFLLRLDPQTGDLDLASYYGGSADDLASDVTTDGQDAIYVVGATRSSELIPAGPIQSKLAGSADGFVLKLEPGAAVATPTPVPPTATSGTSPTDTATPDPNATPTATPTGAPPETATATWTATAAITPSPPPSASPTASPNPTTVPIDGLYFPWVGTGE